MKDRNGKDIKVGDTVEWTAEASGFSRPREGKVIELLAKKQTPKTFGKGVTVNLRSDRVVVECERVHTKGTTKEILTPVLSRVSIVEHTQPLAPANVNDYVSTGAESGE